MLSHVREHRGLAAEQGPPQVVGSAYDAVGEALVLGEGADQPVDRADVAGPGRADHG
jgi:hypothetical protein